MSDQKQTPNSIRGAMRRAAGWALMMGLAACGASIEPLPGQLLHPPLPDNLESIDPEVRERVRAAADHVENEPLAVEAWGDLGKLYEVVGLRAQALVCYDQAQRLQPDEPRWWYRSAVCRGRMDDVVGAMGDLEHMFGLDSTYGPAHHRHGVFALENGDLELAQASFERAVEAAPDFFGGHTGLAQVHLQRDENQQAVERLERLQRLSPSDGVVGNLLTAAYRQARIERSLVVDPDAPLPSVDPWDDPWQNELSEYRRPPSAQRNMRLLLSGDVEPVIVDLEQRRLDEPDNVDFYAELASAYYQVGRLDEAFATYRKLIEREPENITACMALGRMYESEGRPRDALPWYTRATEIDPTFGQAASACGRVLFEGERYGSAVIALERAIELDARDANLYFWLGTSRAFGTDWSGAVRDLSTFIEREPTHADAWLWRAKAHMKLGELQTAGDELQRVRELGTARPTMLAQVQKSLDRALERAAKKAARNSKRKEKNQ